MIANIDEKIRFIKGLKEYSQTITENTPEWLNEIRGDNLNHFLDVGIPTVKDEEWKYTNISSIIKREYEIAKSFDFDKKKIYEAYAEEEDLNIVLVNGVYNEELSNFEGLEDGVTITTLNKAIEDYSEEIQKYLEKYKTEGATPFVALNNALNNQGTYIRINKNTHAQRLIHLIHVTTSNGIAIFTAPRTLISVGQSAEASILETHIAFDDSLIYLTNALTDVFLGENATLHYCKAQSESRRAFHIGNTRVWELRNSNFDGFSLMVGGAITRNDLNIVVDGEGANATLNGLYSISDKQLADNHTSVDHRQPNCTSTQLYKGILNGASHAVFNGKIFVHDIAQLTNSYQLNKNLMLGKDCHVDTKPQLEIFADDVKCTHGATIGQLDEDEIFYLQSRSIPKRMAIRMLSHGFVEDIFSKISNQSICKKLNILIEPTFQAIE